MTIEKISNNQQAVFDPLEGEGFQLGAWQVFPSLGVLVRDGQRTRVEPKVMALLEHLARAAPQPLSREQLMEMLWPQQIVGDDALARCVLKLRRALEDDARAPVYLETLPKRGYRLLPSPSALATTVAEPSGMTPAEPVQDETKPVPHSTATLPITEPRHRRMRLLFVPLAILGCLFLAAVIWQQFLRAPPSSGAAPVSALEPIPTEAALLLQRADDSYYQFERQANETAASLYQGLLAQQDALPAAMVAAAKAGLAAVLVQRVIRWPAGAAAVPRAEQSLSAARQQGRTASAWARASLDQAHQLVADALLLASAAPAAARARIYKTAGLLAALEGRLEEAKEAYLQALVLAPDLWEAQLNLGEVAQMQGQQDLALQRYQQAYASMKAQYFEQPQRIGPWLASLGVLIAQQTPDQSAALQWYREVLSIAPLDPAATTGLARHLLERGEIQQAQDLCAELILRIGPNKDCQAFMPERAGSLQLP